MAGYDDDLREWYRRAGAIGSLNAPTLDFNFIGTPYRAITGNYPITFAAAQKGDNTNGLLADDVGSVGHVTNLIPWYNQQAGTFVVDTQNSTNDANFRRAFSVNDASGNNEIYVGLASGNIRGFSVVGGVTQASFNLGSWGTAPRKVAFAFSSGSAAMCTGGGAVTTTASASFPTVSTFDIGGERVIVAAAVFNGYIRRITYWPRRLSNSELMQVTR